MSEKTNQRRKAKKMLPPPPFHLVVGGAPGGGKTPSIDYYSTDLMRERIGMLMSKHGTNAKAVSSAAGLAATFVSDILAERSTSPGLFPVMKIAAALKTSLAFLIGESDDEHSNGQGQQLTQRVPMVATVETGAYRAIPADPQYPLVHAPGCVQHPDADGFAVLINDHAMNACPGGAMVPGMQALCVNMGAAGLLIESGRLYCLRRTEDGGRTWEWLIRRARVFSDRIVFEAESHRPGFEPIVVRGPVTIDGGVKPSRRIRSGVVVVGLVYKVTIDVLF